MGIVLDSIRMETRLPDNKLNRAREILNSFTQRRSVRLFELQSGLLAPFSLRAKPWSQEEPSFKG